MRFWPLLVVAGGLLVLSSRVGSARSTPIPGPLKGPAPLGVIREAVLTIAPLHEREALLAVGTRKGLYVSSDSGKSFSRISLGGMGKQAVQSLLDHPIDPRIFFCGVGSRLLGSRDGGYRWHRILNAKEAIHSIAVDPFLPTLFLLGTGSGVQRSLDQGTTWQAIPSGSITGPVKALVFDPLHSGRCYALTPQGLYRSEDGGVRWDRIRVLPPRQEEGIDPQEDPDETEPSLSGGLAVEPSTGRLYLGTVNGILISPDGGGSFRWLDAAGLSSPEVFQLLLDPKAPDRLYAATQEGLFFTEEGKGIWQPLREGLPGGPVRAVAFGLGSQHLWVGTIKGLFRIPVPERKGLSHPFSAPLRLSGASSQEPSIQGVHQAAIRYAEAMPEKIQGWRRDAALRNFLPKFTLELDRDRDTNVVSSTSKGVTTFTVGPESHSLSVDFGFTWDLANFIWNPDQTAIDTRSRLMVQLRQEILEEVTRVYFERKRLLAEFTFNPSEDPLLNRERALRIEELTAELDALTGGWFSRNSPVD